jgi:hypothetical protein
MLQRGEFLDPARAETGIPTGRQKFRANSPSTVPLFGRTKNCKIDSESQSVNDKRRPPNVRPAPCSLAWRAVLVSPMTMGRGAGLPAKNVTELPRLGLTTHRAPWAPRGTDQHCPSMSGGRCSGALFCIHRGARQLRICARRPRRSPGQARGRTYCPVREVPRAGTLTVCGTYLHAHGWSDLEQLVCSGKPELNLVRLTSSDWPIDEPDEEISEIRLCPELVKII